MTKIYNKKFLILLVLFIGAAAIRVALDKNLYINNIVGFINIVSLLYVLFVILDYANECFLDMLNKITYLGENIKDKKRCNFKKKYKIVCGVSMIIGTVYGLIWANSIVNDIIGFIALFLSLEDDYISESIAKIFIRDK